MSSNITWNDVINSTKDPLTPEVAEQFIKCIVNKESSRKITLPDDRPTHDDPSFDIFNTVAKENVELMRYIINKIKNNLGNMDEIPVITSDILSEKGLNPNFFSPTKEELTELFSLSDDELTDLLINNNDNHTSIKPLLDKLSFNMTNLFGDHIGMNSIFKNEHSNKNYQSRIYLNTPTSKVGTDFLSLFIKKCLDKDIPYDMKGLDKLDNSVGKDKTVIYSHSDYTLDHIKILEEIANEHPEWIKDFGTPIHLGGSPELSSTPWYSLGYSPTNRETGNRMTTTYNDFMDHSGLMGLGSAICQSLGPDAVEGLRNLYNKQFGENIPSENWKDIIKQLSDLSATKPAIKGGSPSHYMISGKYQIAEINLSYFLISDNGLNLNENFDKFFPENSSVRENFIKRFKNQTEKVVSKTQPDKSLSEIYLSAEMCDAYDKEEKVIEKRTEPNILRPAGDLPEYTSHSTEHSSKPDPMSKWFKPAGDLPEYTSHGTYHSSKSDSMSKYFRPATDFDLDR